MDVEIKTRTNDIQAIYPANSLQQGFIVHAITHPNDDAYIVQTLCDYYHEINIEAYREAWNSAIQTYPALRLCFNWDESPIQIITKHGHLNFTLHDISSSADKNAALVSIQESDRQMPFDLTKPTLLRIQLIKQNDAHYTLLKTEHHSILDAWSAAILLNQIHYFYHQLCAGITPPIIPDNAYLQAQTWITKHQTEAQQHWLKILENTQQANDINLLLTYPATTDAFTIVKKPQEITIELDATHYARLRNIVREEGLTLHGVVQFAWHKILYTYTQDAQTIVGTTVSGRALPITGVEKSAGLYVNTLPLTVQWDNALTIKEQLHNIHESITGLNKYSFAYLSALQPHGIRLFNTLLLFENLVFDAEKQNDHHTLIAVNRRGTQKLNYPLTVTCILKNNTLQINLKYDETHLIAHDANQLLNRLLFILQQIPCKLNSPHATLDLLMPDEYQQIMYDWNATNAPYPDNQTLDALFERQALRTPDAIALVCEDQQLTYRALNEKTNQLAHYLHQQGLRHGELVALCLERSLDLLIAILGVLKAGCAYVPIDPEYPLERIQHILQDTETRFLLTQRYFENKLTVNAAIATVFLDQYPYKNASIDPLHIPRSPTDLAYVIYTSGTTGKAKGAALAHQGIVNRLHWMQSTYPLNENDVVLQKTPYGFDVSVWELLWANWTGAKIVMAKPNGHKDPLYLHALIQQEKITVLHFVPSMLSAFTEALHSFNKRASDSLRYVFCSGEALFANQVDAFYQIAGDNVAIHNLYGPTEASIDVTAFACPRGIDTVYIGKPIHNTRTYILTAHLKPVPIGAIGELYLGGVGLAREYWHRNELTAAAFITNPFATQDDHACGYSRLYKTGDRVRWRADGNIEYLGRNDAQIKIRGFRIELKEIEQVMLSYPGILQATAMIKEHMTADHTHRFIAAYYVGSATEKDVHIHLEKQLPEYMLPTSLMAVAHFPVSRNGKLDKNALPLPYFMQENQLPEKALPQSELEKKLCAIWKSVLKVPAVTLTDNFFELGGDSIRSIRLVSKMQAAGFTVSLNDIFKYPTIAELIEHSQQPTQLTQEKTYTPFSLMDDVTPSNHVAEHKLSRIKKLFTRKKKSKTQTAYHITIEAPRTALEKSLCDIWKSVLNIPRVGINNNFFELGGDSILSIRLIAKMQEIGFTVSVTDIFKYKTIAQLIENAPHTAIQSKNEYASFSLLDNTTTHTLSEKYKIDHAQDMYPASYLQMGMLVESMKAEAQGAYHDVFAYKIHRPLNEALLLSIFKALSDKHPLLRTAFSPHAEYGYVCVQYADIDMDAHYGGMLEENILSFIQHEKNRAIPIDQPGLFCLFVLNPTEDAFILVFSFHHAITDGWSVAALIAEFSAAYTNGTAEIAKEIIPLYQRVIQQERIALASPEYETFWRDYLTEAPLPIPHLLFFSKSRIEKNVDKGCVIDESKSADILSAAKRLGVSPDCLFLAAYFKTLSRFSNHNDVMIGLVMNNRLAETGGDKVFGLHLNTLPFRLFVHDNSVVFTTELFDQKTRLDTYKAYPYGKIRTEILRSNNAYTCAFNYMHFHVADAALDAKELSAMQLFEKTTIPMTLHVSRHHNNFQIVIKALHGFIDLDTAALTLDYIKHDLQAIIDNQPFSWLSTDHPALFQNNNKTKDIIDSVSLAKIEKIEPRNDFEKSLCELWQTVLTVSQVFINDNFFELGGDSILSIRLLAKMQEINFNVSVSDIFKYKTILALIDNVKQIHAPIEFSYKPFSLIDAATHTLFNAIPNCEDIYPASYFQTHMLTESLNPHNTGLYHDVFAYHIYRPFNEARLLTIFNSLSIKHPLLRTAFVTHAEGYICVQYADINMALHYGGIIENNMTDFIQQEKHRVIAIDQPGLFKLFIVNHADDQFTLVFSFHHAITDGWSVASLMSEFMHAYASEQKVITDDNIPPYQRVIQQERLALDSSEHLNFWKTYLLNAPASQMTTVSHDPFAVEYTLPEDKAMRVLATAKRLGVSVDSVFLAAYFKAVSELSKQTDVIIGVVMNNRLEEVGGDKVFGLHLNILPMRMHLSSDPQDQLILAFAEERLKLAPHKIYPYHKLLMDMNRPDGFYSCAFNYTHFHINESQTQEKMFQPVYAFEKMAVPLMLQIARYHHKFSVMFRVSDNYCNRQDADTLFQAMQKML